MPSLEALLGGENFAPEAAELAFQIVGSDYAVDVFARALFGRLHVRSARSCLRFHGWHPGAFDDVRRGRIDLAFFGGDAPDDLRSEPLHTEPFVCVVPSDDALADVLGVSLDEYLNRRHLVVDVEDGEQLAIQRRLEARGLRRTPGLVIPYHASATDALPGTDLVATLPQCLAPTPTDSRFRVLAPPLEIEPMTFKMCWHPLTDGDAAQAWMRDLVRECSPNDATTGQRSA